MITVNTASWDKDEAAIKSVRIPVFVEEQNVPFERDLILSTRVLCIGWQLMIGSALSALRECFQMVTLVEWQY